MNEIKYPLNNFDLKAFIGSEVSFIRDQGTRNPAPVTAIPVVENDGSTPHLYEHAADRTPHDELIDEQKTLYFPFSNSNNGEPVLCADGRVYTLPQGKEEANQTSGMFTIGPSDTVGFMVNVSNNEINIKKAKQFIGNDKKHAYVQPLDSLGVFESGMNNFLDGFKFS